MAPRTAALLLTVAALSAACQPARPHPLRLVLSLHGADGRPVHGVDVTVALPPGTSVAHDPATRRVAPGALALLAGAARATADGHFAPHEKNPSVRILVASASPLRDGPLVAVDVTVTSGVAPSRGRFEVASAAVAGPDGASVPGATAWISAVEPR